MSARSMSEEQDFTTLRVSLPSKMVAAIKSISGETGYRPSVVVSQSARILAMAYEREKLRELRRHRKIAQVSGGQTRISPKEMARIAIHLAMRRLDIELGFSDAELDQAYGADRE